MKSKMRKRITTQDGEIAYPIFSEEGWQWGKMGYAISPVPKNSYAHELGGELFQAANNKWWELNPAGHGESVEYV